LKIIVFWDAVPRSVVKNFTRILNIAGCRCATPCSVVQILNSHLNIGDYCFLSFVFWAAGPSETSVPIYDYTLSHPGDSNLRSHSGESLKFHNIFLYRH
jgi:hypothetical protein